MKAGRTKSIVELVDLFPTLAEFAGLKIPDKVQGRSLVPVLEDQGATVKESALSFTGSGIAMRSKGWSYARYRDGEEELYDMAKDPGQFTNLANDPAALTVLKIQRAAFDERVKEAGVKMPSRK